MQDSDHKHILRRIAEVENRITNLREQQEEAEATLRSLRDQLAHADLQVPVRHRDTDEAHVPEHLTPAEKVALFRHLFRGRKLSTADLGSIDEFHIRGRQATLELAESMALATTSRVLDIGSGLGGPARTLAETFGCHVTGIDLTKDFCDAADAMSEWVRLRERVNFTPGDATDLPFEDNDSTRP